MPKLTPPPSGASLPSLDDKRASFIPGINPFISGTSREISLLSMPTKPVLLLALSLLGPLMPGPLWEV